MSEADAAPAARAHATHEPHARRRATRAAAGTLAVAAIVLTVLGGIGGSWAFADPSDARLPASLTWLRLLDTSPPLASLSKGPVLRHAQQRGELRVGVRRYPRPAPAEAPTPPEPDAFDATLARQLADSLGLKLKLVGLAADERESALRDGRIDLLVAGVADATAHQPGIAAAPGSYDTGRGQVVALRRGRVQDEASLRGASVCVGEGSGYAGAVAQRYGAQPRSYPSSVHAASAFMAGECAALADDGEVLKRLMLNEEWRFYKPLAQGLPLGSDATVRLAEGDAVSRDYIAAALRRWHADGTLEKARSARAGNLQFEITLLKDGLVCHS
jgi:polar amino acid transport system substrate-binding protein